MKNNLILVFVIFCFDSCTDQLKLNEYKGYYPSGELYEIYLFDENNWIQGEYISFYKSGIIKNKKNYINDSLNGNFHEFYENGKLHYKCNLSKDLNDGDYLAYFETGNILSEGEFYKGQMMKMTHYYINGKVRSLMSYSLPSNRYNSNVYFDKKGNIIDSISNYINVNLLGNDSIQFIYPQFDEIDSMTATITNSFTNPSKIIIKKSNFGSLSFSINKEFYSNDTLKIIIECYFPPKKSNDPNIYYSPYSTFQQIELAKGEKPTKYNVDPIY